MTDRTRQQSEHDQDLEHATLEYDEAQGEQEAGEQQPSPAPYDVAPAGTDASKIIVKGERERPGPTDDEPEAARPYDGETGDLGGDGLHRAINDVNDADGQGLVEDE